MTAERQVLPATCDVAIVGGGPAGLALATALKRHGIENVVILEREDQAGGIPRHCGHYPFGMREFGRLLRGPEYARRLVNEAERAGVALYKKSSVTALHPGGRLGLATPDGVSTLQAKRVALCTGGRESSRAQRLIGGDRPSGVITTGTLQSMVYLQRMRPFRRPVILGTELVSFSALLTCRHAGIRPAAMIEEGERVTARAFSAGLPYLLRVPLFFGTKAFRIIGRERVEAVRLTDDDVQERTIEADGVIVTGRFQPEAALLRMSHLETDPRSGGPVIDQYGRCSDPSYVAAGNLLRPVETAGWSFREGEAQAARIARDLTDPHPLSNHAIPLRCAHPALRYALPQRLVISDRSRAMPSVQLRLNQPFKGKLMAESEGIPLWQGHLHSRPERRVLIPLRPLLAGLRNTPINLTLRADG